MPKNTTKIIFRLIQFAVICVFFGRSYQHFFWDAPLRTLLWDEALMSGIVEWWTGFSWEEYVTSGKTDQNIDSIKVAFGWFYLLCGLVAMFIRKLPRVLSWLLPLGAIALIFLAGLYCKTKFFSIGQFFEYSLQFGAPIFLFLLFFQKRLAKRNLFLMKVAIALAFSCHGLYAINFYPRPGLFVQMVMSSLYLSESAAIQLLNAVSVLDFVVAIGVFMPSRFARPILLYAAFWGFLTSVARIYANFYLDFWQESMHQWAFEAVYRAPHFLIPLAAWYWLKKDYSTS